MMSREKLPAVSVIVLTYNQSESAIRAVASAVATAGPDCEIVVSDDGSTDGTREQLERFDRYNPGRIRLLTRHENLGVVDNYFYALSECRGRYITDVAGDDSRLDSDALTRQAAMLDARPDTVAVSARWRVNDRVAGVSDTISSRELMTRLLALEKPQPVMLSAMLYRKSVIDDILKSNPRIVCDRDYRCEDLPVMLALLNAGEILTDSSVVLEYSPDNDSVTHTCNFRRKADYAAGVCRAVCRLSRHYGLNENPRVKNGLQGMLMYLLGCAAASGDKLIAREALTVCEESGVRFGVKGHIYKMMLRNPIGLRSIVWLKRLIGS